LTFNHERFDFLELGAGGRAALIIGGLDADLATQIGRYYPRIIVADWVPARLEKSRKILLGQSHQATDPSSADIDTIELSIGAPEFPNEQFDCIMTTWAEFYLGKPASWISNLTEKLQLSGRLVLIDRIERPKLAGQEITSELIDLRLELDAATGKSVHPGCDPDRMLEEVRSAALTHVRQRIFTDPDLLCGKGYWRDEVQRLRADIESLPSESDQFDSRRGEELRRRISELCQRLVDTEPETPPFVMLSGVKRARIQAPARETTEMDQVGEAATTPIYLGKANHKVDPYERILLYGPDSLKNQDLMMLALSTQTHGQPDEDVDPLHITQKIIREYGSKAITEERNPGRLADMLNVSLATACQVVAIFELGRRFFEEPFSHIPIIRGPEDAWGYLRNMGLLKKEHLRGLYLNVQSRLIHDEVISIGTLSRAVVHPREVFAPALEHAANSVILAHNHPSGDLTPSQTDVTITKQVAQAGRIMGIELLDHIIIGAQGFVSLKKKGII